MLSTIRNHRMSFISVILVGCLFAFLALAACTSQSKTQLHSIAKFRQATACTKNIQTYQYANGYSQPENEWLEATTLSCRTNAPWAIVIHGGSWINGEPSSVQLPVDQFYQYGWQVFNIEYRRGTNITWGMQKNDVVAAYNWIVAHASTFGLDTSKGTAYGFSAGGHMAAWLGNLKPISSVLTTAAVLQPQRVASDDNGLRPDTEPTTPEMHALHNREVAMMGCDWDSAPGGMTAECKANWDAFDPETAITSSSAPVYMVQGDDDPVIPLPSPDAYGYWLRQAGVDEEVVHAAGYGHALKDVFGSTSDATSRWYTIRQWIASKW